MIENSLVSNSDKIKNLLKTFLITYLDEPFFKEAIDKCFVAQDIDFEEIEHLIKAVKINLYVKAYVYILKSLIAPKLKHISHLDKVYIRINKLDLNFSDEEQLFEFAEMIKTDEQNLLSHIFSDIVDKLIELEDKVSKLVQENNNLRLINKQLDQKMNEIEKEFQEEIRRSKDFLIKHNEITERLQLKHENNIESLTKNYTAVIENNKKTVIELEKEIKRLEDQKIDLKRHCEETITKLKNELVETEYLIDKRLIGNCLLKYLDKKNKDKKIQQLVLETLANYLDYSNEERKLIGLSPLGLNHSKSLVNTTTDKIREVSENFRNFLSQV